MTVVQGDIRPYVGAVVGTAYVVKLSPVGSNGRPVTVHTPDGRTIIPGTFPPVAPDPDNGIWTATLEPCDGDATPDGFRWERLIVSVRDEVVHSKEILNVPTSVTPVVEGTILDDTPGTIESSALSVHKADLTAHGNPLGALATHEAHSGIDGTGVHGVIDHDWDMHGWAPFTPVTITEDAATSASQSVVGGKGVLTGAGVGGGDRIAYLRSGTEWLDSEITSLIIGPTGWVGNNAQQGHLHRIRPISPGSTTYEAIAVWTAVFGGGYNLLNTQNVRFDGTSLLQGGGPGASSADAGYIDRTARITAIDRFQFINWISEYTLADAALLSHLIAGDLVTITGTADATMNETNVAVLGQANIATSQVQVQDPAHTTAVPLTFSGGSIVPTSNEKKYCPYWLSTRVRGGSAASVTGQWKRWRHNEPEPPWSDPRVQTFTCVPDVDIPAGPPAAAGFCGLWNAHVSNGSTTQWGPVRFRKL
jgi:hypothetical protein